MGTAHTAAQGMIRTPDQRIRVFVSSTLGELAHERRAVREAVEQLRLTPVMFELGARPHPPRELYRSYLAQSDVFVGVYWERYGWVAPGESISGLEDEFVLGEGMPRLLYLKEPAPGRQARLEAMLEQLRADGSASYRTFSDRDELRDLVLDDLAVLLTERFDAGPGEAFPADRAVFPSPPVPVTETVGRDEDVAEVVRLLRGGVRLLTVSGPGGIGKTRLALEVARELRGEFANGVVFVPLESVTESGNLLRALRERVVVGPAPATQPALDALVETLSERRVLLVLDNVEQLVEAAPELAQLLSLCPRVQALVTSQRVLRVAGEQEYPLGSLSTSTAVELFVQRARAVRPEFQLTNDNEDTVVELCRRLDGLPLAIELAAARTRLLSPEALLARLERRLDLLTSGGADLPERQRTLRATLDWSYRLLDTAEQRLLARLAVFAGGATLEAAEAICGDEHVPDVLETLSSLMEKSLVVAADVDSGQPRVRLLQVVRDYAAERLSELGELEVLQRRHAHWFVDFVQPANMTVHDDGHRHWPTLEIEADNLRATATAILQDRDLVLAARFEKGAWPWMWQSGRLKEFQEWMETFVPLLSADVEPATAAALSHYAAHTRYVLGDAASALELSNQAVMHVGKTDDIPFAALVRLIRATLLLAMGQIDDAADDAEAAVATATQTDNDWMTGYAFIVRGNHLLFTGDLAGARADFEVALDAAGRIDADVLRAHAHGSLAWTYLAESANGEAATLHDARRHLRAQLDGFTRARNLEGLGYALDSAAGLALVEQRVEDAARALGAANAVRERLRMPAYPTYRTYHDGFVQTVRDQLGSAAADELMHAAGALDPWSIQASVLGEAPPDGHELTHLGAPT